MNTKLYIKFKAPKRKAWEYASCVVEDTVHDLNEAEDLLSWGHKYNNYILLIMDSVFEGRLDDYRVIHFEETDETPQWTVNFSDKPEFLVKADAEIKKIAAETKKFKRQAKVAEEKNARLQVEIDKLKAENIAILKDNFGLTDAEAEWADTNWQVLEDWQKNSFWRLTPRKIRELYAEANNTIPSPTLPAFEPIKPIEFTGDYIEVLGVKVNPQLFKDYITHLSMRVKSWDAHEYETKRVILHQRLFEALGADRTERDRGRGRDVYDAIEDVLKAVHKCLCGGSLNGYNQCDKCYAPLGLPVYLENLRNLTQKAE
jgi:hypothetical protein